MRKKSLTKCEYCNKKIIPKRKHNLYYYGEEHYFDSVKCVFSFLRKLKNKEE